MVARMEHAMNLISRRHLLALLSLPAGCSLQPLAQMIRQSHADSSKLFLQRRGADCLGLTQACAVGSLLCLAVRGHDHWS